ncbi:MAG: ribonuclease D [Leptospiraceae bacterium]|nr:ribonuclease D [Leptospiraceae bacterium]
MHPKLLQHDLDQETATLLEREDSLALDCEMMGLNPFRDRLCVVQIGTASGECFLVQLFAGDDPVRLRQVLENQAIQKIFHYARLDLLFLKMQANIETANIYCTKIASRLSRTYTDRHGLKEVVRDLLGEKLDKQNQSSDWGRAELSTEQIYYAAYDVKYLFAIRSILDQMLEREGRTSLARELFAFLPVQRKLDELQLEGIFEH